MQLIIKVQNKLYPALSAHQRATCNFVAVPISYEIPGIKY